MRGIFRLAVELLALYKGLPHGVLMGYLSGVLSSQLIYCILWYGQGKQQCPGQINDIVFHSCISLFTYLNLVYFA